MEEKISFFAYFSVLFLPWRLISLAAESVDFRRYVEYQWLKAIRFPSRSRLLAK
ncbi:MAG TPA: hypothetical protein VKV96_13085 [Roseiarcus sp.]|nr:hypothetical protein [Roseiarcus sp.]